MGSLLTYVMGKSGRAMIEALIAGETNPTKLASLADRRVNATASLCAFIPLRSALLMPAWRQSMRKWRPTLGPFAPLADECSVTIGSNASSRALVLRPN